MVGSHVGQRMQTLMYRMNSLWDVMYGMVTTVSYVVLGIVHLKFAMNVDLKHSHHKKKVSSCVVIDVFINLIWEIKSQCLRISNCHIVHFKYVQFYSSVIPLYSWEKKKSD